MHALLYALAYLFAVVVHESGHVLAGLAVGIPLREMRISLARWPPHVALRAADRTWVSPAQRREYVRILTRWVRTATRGYVYGAGGLVVTTVVVLAVAAISPHVGTRLVGVSLVLDALYLVVDAWYLVYRRRSFGDFSTLWLMRRSWTVVLVVMTFVPRIVVLALSS